MKSLKEIKEEVAKEYKFTCWESIRFMDWDYQERLYNIATNRYAKEVSKQTQINCADNARIEENDIKYKNVMLVKSGSYSYSGDESPVEVSISKNSILDEKNIPEI